MANDIEIRVRVANQASAGLSAVTQAVSRLRTAARGASSEVRSLGTRATATAAALLVLEQAAERSSSALDRVRDRSASTSTSLGELRTQTMGQNNALRTMNTRLDTADSRMSTLNDRTNTLHESMTNLGHAVVNVQGNLGGLQSSLGNVSHSAGNAADNSRKLMMAALALAPAVIPVAAAVTPLVPALGAAAAGMAAFAVALLPQIIGMKKASEATKAYTDALEEHGKGSKEAAAAENEMHRQLEKVSPEARRAAAAFSVFQGEIKAWSKSVSGDTLQVATKSFAVFGALFPKLTPLVRSTSAELGRMMDRLEVGVHSAGFDAFMVKFTDFATRTLHSAIDGLGNLGRKLATLDSNSEFQRFLAYVKETGPLVSETFRNLVRAVANLVESLSGAGVSILTVVNAFAKLVAAIPPSLLAFLVQGYAAFKLFAAGVAAVTAVASSAAVARLVAFFGVIRSDGLIAGVQAAAGAMTALQKAALGLGVLALVTIGISKLADKARGAPPDVDRLTTSLKRLAETGKFTGELKKTFGDVEGLVKKIKDLQSETKKAAEATEGAFGFRVPVLDDIGQFFGTKITEIAKGEKSLKALQADFKGLDEAMSNLVTSGHADVAAKSFDQIVQAAREQGISVAKVKELLPEYGDAVAALAADQKLAAQAMGLFGEQAIAVQAKLDAQKRSTDGLRQAIQALNDVNRSALGGMIGFETAIDAATKAAAENAGSLTMVNGVLDLNSEKSRNAATALNDLAAKTDEAAAAARENGAGWTTVNGIYERGRAQLIASAKAMGLTEAQARSLAAQILRTPDKTARLKGNMEDLQSKLNSAKSQLARVPDSRKAQVRAEISSLTAAIRRARDHLNSINGYTATTYIITHSKTYRSVHDIVGKATGGVIGAAGGGPRSRMTLVGEQGPELVDLAPGSRVRSNPDSRRIADGMAAGGGGGGPMVLEVRSSGSRIDDLLLEILRKSIRVRGGNVQLVLGG